MKGRLAVARRTLVGVVPRSTPMAGVPRYWYPYQWSSLSLEVGCELLLNRHADVRSADDATTLSTC